LKPQEKKKKKKGQLTLIYLNHQAYGQMCYTLWISASKRRTVAFSSCRLNW
jgi:hypothetical protein